MTDFSNAWLKDRLETDYSDATAREKVLIDTMIKMGAIIISMRRSRHQAVSEAWTEAFDASTTWYRNAAMFGLAFVFSLMLLSAGKPAYAAPAFFLGALGIFYAVKRVMWMLVVKRMESALFDLHEGPDPFGDDGLIGRRRG